MTPEKRRNFERLLNPRHIAFIGGADAAIAIGEARRAGFAGQMWAVNPRRDTLNGLPCLKDIADLPAPPDAVFLAVPAPVVPASVTQLRQIGTGGLICYSAGFSEAHDEGAALEVALKSALGDMAMIGPNCYGIINYIGKSALWPFAHGGSCPGYGAAIITQSGMFSSDITMSQRSLPMAYMASAGNQVDLGLTELVDLLCDRSEVRAIGLHIEGLSDIPAFERIALKSIAAGTPVVALKTGRSKIGETLTLSHTGSLAGSDTLYQALFDRVGIIRVTNPSQFLETLKYLCITKPPTGTDVVGFTCSGGGATMLADHAETIGLGFPAPDIEAHSALTDLLPDIATVSNPLDYTTPIWGQADYTQPVFETAMARLPAQAALLVQDYPAPGLDESEQLYLNDGLAFARAAKSTGLSAAICATIPENIGPHIRETLIQNGVAPMQGVHEALNAIRDAAWWQAKRDSIMAAPPSPLLSLSVDTTPAPRTLTEANGKAYLVKAGFPVPLGRLVTRHNLGEAGDQMGYPLVLKMMSPALAHKTEAGAVALGLLTRDALTEAAQDMRHAVERHNPAAVTDDYLIEPMSPPPLAELVVALRRDPQFGMALTLGSGGLLVELLGDTVTVLLPATPSDILAALDQLRVKALLDGFRGKPAVNRTALAEAISQLANHAIAHADTLAELEINPLFVYETEVLAIDVLMQLDPG